MMRATSRLALLISLGVSSRSVADWKRRWNKCLTVSLSVKSSCSSLISRYSDGFISRSSSLHRQPGDQPALERHLVGDSRQAVSGGRFGQAGNFEQDHAGLDDGGPVFRFTLALAHARFGGDGGDRLMRE